MKRSETIGSLAAALANFHAAVTNPRADKTADAGSYSYNYIDFAQLLDTDRVLLAAQGLCIVQEVIATPEGVGATTMILHESGEYLELDPMFIPSGDSAQDYGTAATYARRYSYMAALDLAGADRWSGPQWIYADGWRPSAPGWCVSSTTTILGSLATFLRLLREISSNYPDLDLITYCQDDVLLVRDALEYIRRVVIPNDVGLASWFAESIDAETDLDHPQLSSCRLATFYNSQLITFRADLARELLESFEGRQVRGHGCDLSWTLLSGARDRCFVVHTPSLAQHARGADSACGHSTLGSRTSPYFPGTDFSAMKWVTPE